MLFCSDSPQPAQTPGIQISRQDFFYVSNILSLLRLLLVPFIYYSVVHHHRAATVVFGGLAVLSDALDGYFARRFNQQSDLGKILDPIADKLAIGSVILALVLSNKTFPLWAFGIVILRDLLIVTGSAILFYRARIITRSNRWGKCTTFFLSIALMLYVFGVPEPAPFYILSIGLVFALISTWSYSQRLFRLLQTGVSPHKKVV